MDTRSREVWKNHTEAARFAGLTVSVLLFLTSSSVRALQGRADQEYVAETIQPEFLGDLEQSTNAAVSSALFLAFPLNYPSSLTGFVNLASGVPAGEERLQISSFFAGKMPSQMGLLHAQADYEALLDGRLDVVSFLKRKASDAFGSLPLRILEDGESLTQTKSYRFAVGSVPLCDFKVRYYRFKNGDLTLMGRVPQVYDDASIDNYNGDAEWPSLDLSVELVKDTLERSQGGQIIEAPLEPTRCYMTALGGLVPSWKFLIRRTLGMETDSQVLTDIFVASESTIFKHEAFDFDAKGRVKVYPFNVVKTPTPIQEDLDNLVGDGTLTSDILISAVSSPFKRVQQSSHEFIYDPGTPEFGEVSAFTHATKHLKFLAETGFEWYGLKPLKLTVFSAQLKNNARFVPQLTETIPGQIDIGTSDGRLLQNLELDSDVVSHEVGHFVIYRAVRSTNGESLVLHEGLADYFTFARSNDACLGESICPEDSLACVRPGQCLRTAQNNFRFNDDNWKQWYEIRNSLNHLHGQVLSGLLWDLRTKEIPPADLDKMVMNSIMLLPEDANFSDFFLALASTDKSMFGGAYFAKLQSAAQSRNLGNRFPSVSPNGSLSKSVVTDSQGKKEQLSGQTGSEGESQGTADQPKTTRKNSGGTYGCGTVASGLPMKGSSILWALIIMLVPVGFCWSRACFMRLRR